VEITSLGSLGNVYAFGSNLVNQMDKSYLLRRKNNTLPVQVGAGGWCRGTGLGRGRGFQGAAAVALQGWFGFHSSMQWQWLWNVQQGLAQGQDCREVGPAKCVMCVGVRWRVGDDPAAPYMHCQSSCSLHCGL
jgi:hypothetical protein